MQAAPATTTTTALRDTRMGWHVRCQTEPHHAQHACTVPVRTAWCTVWQHARPLCAPDACTVPARPTYRAPREQRTSPLHVAQPARAVTIGDARGIWGELVADPVGAASEGGAVAVLVARGAGGKGLQGRRQVSEAHSKSMVQGSSIPPHYLIVLLSFCSSFF